MKGYCSKVCVYWDDHPIARCILPVHWDRVHRTAEINAEVNDGGGLTFTYRHPPMTVWDCPS